MLAILTARSGAGNANAAPWFDDLRHCRAPLGAANEPVVIEDGPQPSVALVTVAAKLSQVHPRQPVLRMP